MLETIRDMLDREPFQPFRVVLTSGDRYEVLDPYSLALLQTQIFIAVPRSDSFHFLRLNQIAAVESMQPS